MGGFAEPEDEFWAATPADPATRDAGQPGVRLRMYADLGQVVGERFSPERARGSTK
ncbi:DUF6207 family protein [Streptomyces sp. YS415]|uniref:DUF6207 family protein n=1 Tax=Streptomyces sp. YS415 TaxID=2944806 RepID=UPI0020218CF9|nr:DUF6207 family protein [Streptomyces sp. YS415]MCL7429173.1 DUF6207 family protein [Streptomyces sp. YS415]